MFSEFHFLRKPSCDAIATLALDNFVEMRDKVADDNFLKKKAIERILEQKFKSKFRSRYSMVCYGSAGVGNVTYANALALTDAIDEITTRCIEVYVLDDNGNMSDSDEAKLLKVGESLIDKIFVPKTKELRMDVSTV